MFFLGYRQTVGAKKERIINANAEVEKILVRRIVLENYKACSFDINRLLEGKARDFRVKVGDLYSDSQVLTNIFTRIMESDFIPQSQREDIVGRLTQILEKAETSPVQEGEISELPSSRQYFISKTLTPVVLAGVASVIGGLVTVLPEIGKVNINKEELFSIIFAVTGLSFTIIITVFFFYRLRESQEETTYSSRSKLLKEYLDFERQVIGVIKKSGAKVSPASLRDRGYDFQVSIGGKKILVEIKSMPRRLPTSIIGQMIQKLSEEVDKSGADEGLLITKNSVELPKERLEGKSISIMSLDEFRNYLSHIK